MSEQYVPVPDPEPNSNWDPSPARCGVEGCRNIVQQYGDIVEKGWCSTHGVVTVKFQQTQNFEFEDEESGEE